jgi:hypothetical protein
MTSSKDTQASAISSPRIQEQPLLKDSSLTQRTRANLVKILSGNGLVPETATSSRKSVGNPCRTKPTTPRVSPRTKPPSSEPCGIDLEMRWCRKPSHIKDLEAFRYLAPPIKSIATFYRTWLDFLTFTDCLYNLDVIVNRFVETDN